MRIWLRRVSGVPTGRELDKLLEALSRVRRARDRPGGGRARDGGGRRRARRDEGRAPGARSRDPAAGASGEERRGRRKSLWRTRHAATRVGTGMGMTTLR